MTTGNVLTGKEKALISLSASIAAGCQPCTEHHTKGARQAGACERSVALAIRTGVGVRESATRNMNEWATECQGARPELDAEFIAQKRLVAELAAVASAVAVNSVSDLKAHLETAARAGATPEQIRAAIAIAESIRKTAEQKIAEALGSLVEAPGSCCATARSCC